jgi:hypothetical protein
MEQDARQKEMLGRKPQFIFSLGIRRPASHELE